MHKIIFSYLKKILIYYPKLAFALSDSRFFASVTLYLKVLYFSFSRKFTKKGCGMVFDFKFNKKNFKLGLENNLDLAVLIEIFVFNEYVWKPEHEVKTILDLGAHWGDTAIYYSCIFPEAEIIAVEPMSSSFKRLSDHVVRFDRIKALHAALAEKTGMIDLFYSENSVGNSLTEREQSQSKVTVRAVTVSEIKKFAQVEKFDLVKFDIEGAEQALFTNPEIKNLSTSFIGEIHLDLIEMSLDEIRTTFEGFEVTFNFLKKNRYIMIATNKN
tara:strand:- start:12507 stop:13319 length:813 start_codon:yes stop_codon:yes gene_type:complete